MRTAIALLVVGLAGCAAGATTFRGPDGRQHVHAKCSVDESDCWQQCSAACGGGEYTVLERSTHPGGVLADTLPGPVSWFVIIAECK